MIYGLLLSIFGVGCFYFAGTAFINGDIINTFIGVGMAQFAFTLSSTILNDDLRRQ